MSDKNGKHTLVEEGTEFRGTLTSKCPIVVMGKVEGDITGPNIHVTTTGVVAGNVKVKELRSDGELAGTVEAEAVHVAGRVRDKTVIRARTLQVTLQSNQKGMEVVFGECELAIGDEPNKATAIASAQPEPAKAEAPRRRGASEMWEEGAKPPVAEVAKPATEDDERPARKRGTQPPPA